MHRSRRARRPLELPGELDGERVLLQVLGKGAFGTVYLAPQPGADNFIKVGDKVAAGQTLLIVEAMKTMNPIPAPRAGTVLEIVVADSQPVEFGEPLIVLE